MEVKNKEDKADKARLSLQINDLERKKDEVLDLLLEGRIDKNLLERKCRELDKKIAVLERKRKIVSVNKTKFLVEVSNVIDTLRVLPKTYLKVPKEGKAEILRKMAEGAIIEYKDNQIISGEIIWLEPISYLMKPKILDTIKKDEPRKFGFVCSYSRKQTRTTGLLINPDRPMI